ncbi:MAG: hypothetical protein II793_02285, partial [Bacteroidales bacterium]|nr:hypothetical protein [Bacteroidales bacterium]
MEEQKHENVEPQEPEKTPIPEAAAAPLPDDEEDYIATPEEVAAEARRSAERRAQKRKQEKSADDAREFGEFIPPDSLIDPYTDPDPDIPW